ncbi:unnamed protein product [Dracunculus medinensis]|uniref:Helicase ATP-binding domain-containing protein n=1 Tax=Dracunculus medinensis TaxID=318479 RepID=A0A0N4ULG3_DRAME|nr:unnamed protein product [Dracunculus medinensis]
MTIINIDGIEINFPYEPYQCQITFMKKVIESLKNGWNAALESPTGTGKTLCLLCASIAFVRHLKSKIPVDEVDKDIASLYPKILYSSRTHSQLAQVIRELNKTIYRDTKTVTLASRDILCIHENVQKEANNIIKSMVCRNLVKKRKCHYFNEYDSSFLSY